MSFREYLKEEKEQYCVAVEAGRGGYNCNGIFDNKKDAQKHSNKLADESQGIIKSKVVFRKPWSGTQNI